MKKLLILGAGGHSKVIKETAMEASKFNTFDYLDDNKNLIKENFLYIFFRINLTLNN